MIQKVLNELWCPHQWYVLMQCNLVMYIRSKFFFSILWWWFLPWIGLFLSSEFKSILRYFEVYCKLVLALSEPDPNIVYFVAAKVELSWAISQSQARKVATFYVVEGRILFHSSVPFGFKIRSLSRHPFQGSSSRSTISISFDNSQLLLQLQVADLTTSSIDLLRIP